MTSSYTEEKLSSMEKETIIQLFLAQQEQLENINKNLQFVLGQLDIPQRDIYRNQISYGHSPGLSRES